MWAAFFIFAVTVGIALRCRSDLAAVGKAIHLAQKPAICRARRAWALVSVLRSNTIGLMLLSGC
jgi:hypothetical protein